MTIRCLLLLFATAWRAEPSNFCLPPPEVEKAIEKADAATAAVTDPFAAWDRATPYQAVRDRYPEDLFAHERYQDAIHEYGIEGHLQLLAKQYTQLEAAHSGDTMYHYLRLRATVGRNTAAAIRDLNELLQAHPDFAPAHQTLAEIYGTDAFRQPERERSEKEKYLAACPGGTFTKRPPSVPELSPLLGQAERLLAEGGEPDRVIQMTYQGLRELNWRTQRIRCFDWYGRDYKIQDARELRLKYWQAWPIQVRAFRKAGNSREANQVLATMEARLEQLRDPPGSGYWDAEDVLAQLYAEGGQTERAAGKIDELRRVLAETADAEQRTHRAARIEQLEGMLHSAEH
jgi:hypothetical protein